MSAPRVRLATAGLTIDLVFHGATGRFPDLVRLLWAPALTEAGGEPTFVVNAVIPSGDGDAAHSIDRPVQLNRVGGDATYRLSGEVTMRILEHLVGSRILLHAGAVILEDLGTVITTGASGAGKSTAVTTLARGGTYLTDELTILDPIDFSITAYPKPISRVYSEPGEPARHKRDYALEDLGITSVCAGTAPAPSHVVLVNRQVDAAEAVVEPLSLLEAVAILAGQSSSQWKLPSPLGSLARLITSLDGVWRATYTEASELPGALRAAVKARADGEGAAQASAADATYEVLAPGDAAPGAVAEEPPTVEGADTAAAGPAPSAIPAERVWRLAPFYEALWSEGEFAVLTACTEPQVVRLTGVSTTVWDLLFSSGPLTTSAIVESVVALMGEHPDADERVCAALASCAEHGVLV
ncbi:MAG: hypothetical protein Q4G21_09500 [Dermabacter sp.]|nr:hypothetical protein [Dermabacter sp.]